MWGLTSVCIVAGARAVADSVGNAVAGDDMTASVPALASNLPDVTVTVCLLVLAQMLPCPLVPECWMIIAGSISLLCVAPAGQSAFVGLESSPDSVAAGCRR